jgi:hypothetical protein
MLKLLNGFHGPGGIWPKDVTVHPRHVFPVLWQKVFYPKVNHVFFDPKLGLCPDLKVIWIIFFCAFMLSIAESGLYHINFHIRGLEHGCMPLPKDPDAAMVANGIADDADHMKRVIASEFGMVKLIHDVSVVHGSLQILL